MNAPLFQSLSVELRKRKEEFRMRASFVALGFVSAMLVACSPAAPAAPPTTASRPTVATAPTPAATTAPAVAKASAAAQTNASPVSSQTGANAGPPSVVKVPVNAAGTFDPATTLIMYGDVVLFAGQDNPENCTEKSRFKRGDPVGFRATAIDPVTGKVDDGAQLTVRLANGEGVQMMYRGGTGPSAHPGLWTGKWVVPDDAPTGVMHYTIEAKDSQGRTAVWEPFQIEPSILTIVQ
jgi:plastocyanin